MSKSYVSLQKQIDALLAQQDEMKDAVAKAFADRIAKDKKLSFLYTMDKRELNKFAGVVCSNIPDIYEAYKEYEDAKTKKSDAPADGGTKAAETAAAGTTMEGAGSAGYNNSSNGGSYGYGQQ